MGNWGRLPRLTGLPSYMRGMMIVLCDAVHDRGRTG